MSTPYLIGKVWQAGQYCCKNLQVFTLQLKRNNSNKTFICRMHRYRFPHMYPTMLVLPNGSTITVRYCEPRKIIKLPFDFSLLSAVEKQAVIQKRKPLQELVVEDEVEDDFDLYEYSDLWKK